ncbi:MAG: hypothetical protein WDN00_17300 [Limisphaerales bacterium]
MTILTPLISKDVSSSARRCLRGEAVVQGRYMSTSRHDAAVVELPAAENVCWRFSRRDRIQKKSSPAITRQIVGGLFA